MNVIYLAEWTTFAAIFISFKRMVSRIAFLCNKTADAVVDIVGDIAMITFTKDAAQNMKVRLKKMFMNYFILTSNEKYMHLIEDMSQIQISTIHKPELFMSV